MKEPQCILGPKWKESLEAAMHLAVFQTLVANHELTGEDIAWAMKLLNANEQMLEAGGAKV